MKQKTKRPLVGIGVIIKNNNKVLLGKRTGSHGNKTWSFPGGHLEFGESFFDCAKREVYEETGIIIKEFSKGPCTNDFFEDENLHYVTVYVKAESFTGAPKIMEPDKCLEWRWFEPQNLPTDLFLPIKNLLREYDL